MKWQLGEIAVRQNCYWVKWLLGEMAIGRNGSCAKWKWQLCKMEMAVQLDGEQGHLSFYEASHMAETVFDVAM